MTQVQLTDTDRIERLQHAGYGGAVSDALRELGVRNTIFSEQFKPLSQGRPLVGRAITVKIHSQVGGMETVGVDEAEGKTNGFVDHPQRRMMQAVKNAPDGTVLCFDCGGDKQPAHFGEMSCQLARAYGCRGLLLAGYCRDTRYVAAMADFPVYCFGTHPNFYGGWSILEINEPIHLPGHLTHYVQVNPGDFIFADSDGAQLIPMAIVDEVIFKVEEVFEQENAQREELAAGMPIEEVYRRYGVL